MSPSIMNHSSLRHDVLYPVFLFGEHEQSSFGLIAKGTTFVAFLGSDVTDAI